MALRVIAVGAAAQVGGLGLDTWLHARDPDLAAREGPLTLANPGHVLVLAGLALVLAGTVVGLGLGRRSRPALLGITAVASVLALTAVAATSGGHDHGDGGVGVARPAHQADHADHGTFGPVTEEPLTVEEQRVLASQWAAAAAAAAPLATIADAEAAGYRQASAQAPGIGTHWIRWDLVDAPFDPEAPSMLLYDQSSRGAGRLAGFSYWVRSAVPPDGFAGPNDHWHQHHGLCFVDRWLDREDVPSPDGCAGEWLQGGDLWMLHAWVVPGMENRWGRFAPRHPGLCPPPTGVPDVLSCSPLRN